MFPAYRDMNFHPYQGHQTPSPQFFNPTWEPVPPQMKEDQAKTRQMHEFWPHNYGYSAPMPCQNCCSHGQHPSYHYFRPPYPHFPSPLPFGHYCSGPGGYPYPAAFPQPYPFVPPPYYPMEMPRYEYDKGSSKAFHCCECPNHPSHVKSSNNVKIEEHDPDGEMKKADSLVPSGVSKSPYPILWVPPEYMTNKERPMRLVGSDADEKRVSPYVEKPQAQPVQGIKPAEQDPNVKYQWFPLDMNSIKRLMEGGEVRRPRDEEKKDGEEKKVLDLGKNGQNKQFAYPIIWMPYDGHHGENNTVAEKQEERNKAKQPVEKHPSALDVVKHPDKELVVESTPVGDHASGAENRGSHKTGIVKIIPVKQLDDHVPKSEKKEQESDVNVRLNNAGENVNHAAAKNDADMKPSSLTKKSKLPPICLRVDPPRKKNGKGSSRSPSPPGKKMVQESGDSKVEKKGTNKEVVKVKEAVENDSHGNDIEAFHGTKEEEKGYCAQEHQSEAEEKLNGTENGATNAIETQETKDSKHEEVGAPVKKILSETEAAVIVQSAYRGYAVRRWESLKKLRQIAHVNEEASKVRKQIEELETCVSFDNKEKVAIGENIMNLLLKLDTIQGLHPSVRDVRRSVAKELITLQEKLDCIVSQKSVPTEPDNSTCSSEINSVAAAVAESSVITGDTSEISEQGEAPTADKSELAQNEGEALPLGESPLSQSRACQDVIEEGFEVTEECVREPHNEELVQPIETSSDYGGPASCLEMTETELEKSTISAEDVSTEPQDPLSEPKHFEDKSGQLDMWSCEKVQEEILLAESPQGPVEEQLEDDICRMDWECDLGAAKINLDIDQETTQPAAAPQEIEQVVNTVAPSEKCAVEVQKEEEKWEHPEVHVEGIKEKEVGTCEVENSTWNTEQVEDQPIDKPDLQSDDSVAVEDEQNVLVETSHEEKPSGHSSEMGMDIPIPSGQESEMGMDIPILEQEPTAEKVPSVTSVTKVEKFVPSQEDSNTDPTVMTSICENTVSNEHAEEVTNGSEDNPSKVYGNVAAAELPEIGKEEAAELQGIGKEEDGNRVHSEQTIIEENDKLPEIGNEDAESVQAEQRIIEENEKLPETGKEEDADRVQAEQKMIEENEKLRDMVEKLLASGKQQQDVISGLTAKVKDLEKKLPKRNKMRLAKRPGRKSLVAH